MHKTVENDPKWLNKNRKAKKDKKSRKKAILEFFQENMEKNRKR
jgi:hypothetical protein